MGAKLSRYVATLMEFQPLRDLSTDDRVELADLCHTQSELTDLPQKFVAFIRQAEQAAQEQATDER